MPTVPNSFVPQVGETPSNTPPMNAPASEPMRNYAPQQISQQGEALSRAGELEMKIGQHIQATVDDASVKAAETRFISQAQDILHGENGYLTKQGADALNGYESASAALVKAKKDALDGLSDGVQKGMFNQVSASHLAVFGAQMGTHRAQQRTEWSVKESLSRSDSMLALANSDEVNSDQQKAHLDAGIAEIRNAWKARGIPADSEQVKKAERDYRTQMVANNVTRLMTDNKFEDAKTVLNDAIQAGGVDPDIADRLKASVTANLERSETITTADNIFAARKGLSVDDVQKALAKVDEQVTDPQQNNMVRALVESKFNDAQRMEQEQKTERYRSASDYFYKSATASGGIQPNSWKAIPTQLFQQLTPEQQYNFIMAGKQSAGAADPEKTADNINARYWFATHPYFTVQDVTDRARTLTPNQIIEFSGQASKRASGMEIKAATVDQKQLQNSLLHSGMGSLFGDSLEKLSYGQQQANKQRYLEIQNDVQGIFDAAESAKKAPLTPQDRQKLLDDYLINNVVYKQIKHTFSKDETVPVRYAGLSDAEIPDAWVDVGGKGVKLSDIPPNVAAKLRDHLVAKGTNPSWQNIAWYWVAMGKPTQ